MKKQIVFVLLLFSIAFPARAAVIHAGPSDDVLSLLRALQPGDELVLGAGTYVITARYGFQLNKTAQNPIAVRAAHLNGSVSVDCFPAPGSALIGVAHST